MRLAAQAKMGFYPIPPEVMSLIATHVDPGPEPEKLNLFDPCCGEGEAINQLAKLLGAKQSRVHAIELDQDRYEKAKALMPEAKILGPASFYGTGISPSVFSIAYVNPPFDEELGGGQREEVGFIERAKWTINIDPGGLLIAVMPFGTLKRTQMLDMLDVNFHNIQVYKFPETVIRDGKEFVVRKFKEVVVFANRRRQPIGDHEVWEHGELCKQGWKRSYDYEIEHLATIGRPHSKYQQEKTQYGSRYVMGQPDAEITRYKVYPCTLPRAFSKIEHTEEELNLLIQTSRINDLFGPSRESTLNRPPMSASRGHVALLLASGRLDGIVPTPDGPHVVRGSSSKKTYQQGEPEEREDPETGAVTIKTTLSEKVILEVRAVDSSGTIYTFKDAEEESEETVDEDGKVTTKVRVGATTTNAPPPVNPTQSSPRPADLPGQTMLELPAPEVVEPEVVLTGQSYKVAIWTFNCDDKGPGSGNGLRFPTFHQARQYGEYKLSTWMAMKRYEVQKVDEEPNYEFVDGRPKAMELSTK